MKIKGGFILYHQPRLAIVYSLYTAHASVPIHDMCKVVLRERRAEEGGGVMEMGGPRQCVLGSHFKFSVLKCILSKPG